MVRRNRLRLRTTNLVALVALGVGVFVAAGAGPSSAQVTTVVGSATGFESNVTLFNGCLDPGCVRGPAPTVTLPAGGSATPLTATAPSASAVYGPATIFSSGPLEVSTEGTTGATGSVTSSAEITDINTSGDEIFTAEAVTSTCTASEAGESGSATVTGGSVLLQDPDSDASGEAGEVVQAIAASPAPNTEFTGKTAPPVEDDFRIVFNEQIANPDGSITVTAVHEYFLGPTAKGELIVGRSVCGVNPTAVTTTTTVGQTTTTTVRTDPLARTGSENDLMIAWAAMALTLGGLFVMGTKSLPGQASRPREGDRRNPKE